MANECIPLYRPGGDLKAKVGSAVVTGKTFVNLSAALDPVAGMLAAVLTASAGVLSVGTAAADAPAGGRRESPRWW